MTSPLVLKSFSLIQKLNSLSYVYIITWDPHERKLKLTENVRKLIPWHIANIGVVFLLHFCLPVCMIINRSRVLGQGEPSDKDILQLGVLVMMSCHSTASYGINFLVYQHARDFVHFFNSLLKFEDRVRNRYITSQDIHHASILKGKGSKFSFYSENRFKMNFYRIISVLHRAQSEKTGNWRRGSRWPCHA